LLDGAGGWNRGFLADWFHQDESSQVLAEGQTHVADLADEVCPARDQLDDLVFAQTDFAQSILKFRRRAEPLDPNRHAHLNAA
jgi:hypothetical protein